ncbi:endonuclease [Proteus phage 3H10_20]|uniref:Endonuclease n=2 Tax=Privateervirus TaxID=2843440 RepID=A0A7L7SHB1_9CAUD|nr:endonuclease [Proteus phage Privateer]YP_010672290.1 endonuclease [Proteus phage 3H10_20]QIN94819.1 endonuclease [Proteus phage Privateer]QOC54813.1 endonuclease [Proteus phage 3H10_20]
MAFKKRYFKKKENILKGTPYDSMLEKNLHETKLSNARFHCKEDKIYYEVPHTYEPDFVIEKDGITYFIETKGRFRDSTEARKYLFIRDFLPENSELVFIWEKNGTVFPFAKKRKDGTKATHQEWADKQGFRHWVQDQFNEELL